VNYQLVAKEIVNWIKNKINEAGAKGAVVGLSGGLDSAVVMALCQRACPSNSLGLIMPCNSNPEDVIDAKLVGEHLKVPYKIIDLTETYNVLLAALSAKDNNVIPQMALANIKPRLRMATLYYYSALNDYLVVGTGNKSEILIGYYTKYGDGGVDIEPIGNLVKSEVVQLARYLEIPEKIITKAPTAGLWEGQTDENEMGFTYHELDNYILFGTASETVKNRIERLIKLSEHKRHTPPIGPVFK
jgi:NAD+ synthase